MQTLFVLAWLPLTPAIREGDPVRWGIMGCGLIASDFAAALRGLPESKAVIVAVGARTGANAEKFAKTFGVDRAYEGYEALAADPDVDVVYVATVAQSHAACVSTALAAGKAVLCEKPLALSESEAAALIADARARRLFLMEGMWTRCFPAVHTARRLLRSGAIGDVLAVSADFGWQADPDGSHARVLDPLSGGVSMDVAMYPIAHILLCLASPERPLEVVASGTSRRAAGGSGHVDWSAGATLCAFPANPRLVATVLCTLDAATPEEVVYTGSKGTLRVHGPAHAPSRLTLALNGDSREAGAAEEVLDFPLPPVPPGVPPLHYPRSQGFVYEASAVGAALRAGQLEADEWTHHETLTTQWVVDAMRDEVVARGMGGEPPDGENK